ncbi:MAG: Energy-coupling factor transporter ATP-binding protein EcfA2 [Firmicutes bacterium ADurb.Bin193]|nr:MAG: Energy-coupling factor transporter ATP-binding protein EcfA2 [Firmicutes bacterium ADurb.Bin193]
MIKTENLSFKYNNEQESLVLEDINLTIEKGEFVAIIGHNGSGKSTLVKHFNAILLPEGGTVYVKGIDTRDESRLYDIRQAVGMVFQNPDNQLVATIVEDDVAFAPENLGVAPSEIRKRVDRSLETVGMSEYTHHAPHLLSGGQKQRVAIAGILAMKPDCIVLDEPTAMLDPIGRREVIQTLLKLNSEEGITIVLVTHNMDEAVSAERVVVLSEGGVEMDGKPREIFCQVERLKALGLAVPQITELMYELSREGINVPCDILTVDEAYNALSQIENYNKGLKRS